MKLTVSYSIAGLHEAAAYIWENNPSISKWPSKPKSPIDVVKHIHNMMTDYALKNAKVIMKEKKLKTELHDEWNTFTGTGGYYISFELHDATDEEISIGADILVDPAIGSMSKGFVTEFIDMIEEEV
jgi:hypothetical protein